MADGEVEFFLEGKVGDKEGGEVVGVEPEGGGAVGGCLVGIVMLVREKYIVLRKLCPGDQRLRYEWVGL